MTNNDDDNVITICSSSQAMSFFRKREKIKKEQFKQLKEKFGEYVSFAIWESENNVKDISMFDDDNITEKLNDKYIFVALNPAKRPADEKVDISLIKKRPFVGDRNDYGDKEYPDMSFKEVDMEIVLRVQRKNPIYGKYYKT